MRGVKRVAKYIPRFNPDVEVLEITRKKDGDYSVTYRWHGKITDSVLREDKDGMYFNAAKNRIYCQDLQKAG